MLTFLRIRADPRLMNCVLSAFSFSRLEDMRLSTPSMPRSRRSAADVRPAACVQQLRDVNTLCSSSAISATSAVVLYRKISGVCDPTLQNNVQHGDKLSTYNPRKGVAYIGLVRNDLSHSSDDTPRITMEV